MKIQIFSVLKHFVKFQQIFMWLDLSIVGVSKETWFSFKLCVLFQFCSLYIFSWFTQKFSRYWSKIIVFNSFLKQELSYTSHSHFNKIHTTIRLQIEIAIKSKLSPTHSPGKSLTCCIYKASCYWTSTNLNSKIPHCQFACANLVGIICHKLDELVQTLEIAHHSH